MADKSYAFYRGHGHTDARGAKKRVNARDLEGLKTDRPRGCGRVTKSENDKQEGVRVTLKLVASSIRPKRKHR